MSIVLAVLLAQDWESDAKLRVTEIMKKGIDVGSLKTKGLATSKEPPKADAAQFRCPRDGRRLTYVELARFGMM